MGTFSPSHWLIVLLMVVPLLALAIVPTWRILQRAGFHGAWSLLLFVPFVNFLLPWVLAFVKWPADTEGRTSTSVVGIVAGVLMLPLALAAMAMSGYLGNDEAIVQAPRMQPQSAAAGVPAVRQPSDQPQKEVDWWKRDATPIN